MMETFNEFNPNMLEENDVLSLWNKADAISKLAGSLHCNLDLTYNNPEYQPNSRAKLRRLHQLAKLIVATAEKYQLTDEPPPFPSHCCSGCGDPTDYELTVFDSTADDEGYPVWSQLGKCYTCDNDKCKTAATRRLTWENNGNNT